MKAEAGGPGAEDTGPATSVTVVGGGIAGLTAAYRLAERGYAVTLLERSESLGGNLGSRKHAKGPSLDVYPHMFQGWYDNFWKLMKDANGDKDPREKKSSAFRPFSSVYQARRPEPEKKVEFAKLTNPYSTSTVLENLYSGIAAPADMFVFGYSSIDLQAEVVNPTMRLRNISLWGYLNSRPYMTRAALNAYEAFILRVWGLPSYSISAVDCRTYGQYCYAAAEEPGWLCMGPADKFVIGPIEKALKKNKKVTIRCGVTVEGVTMARTAEAYKGLPVYSAESITLSDEKNGMKGAEEAVQNLILAVPPEALNTLVRTGEAEKRIVDALPGLAELERFASQRIPVLTLVLHKKLAGLPKDPVALYDSKLSLAFTDISGLWKDVKDFTGKTALAVSCSEPLRLYGDAGEEGFAMAKELAEYLDFKPGQKWQDETGDIDWSLTDYARNTDTKITLNAVGTDPWRPPASNRLTPNLFLAGDFCKHDFGITTVEAAVATGLSAVQALMEGEGKKKGWEPVKRRERPSAAAFVAIRYAWMAAAYASGLWSWLGEAAQRPLPPPFGPGGPPGDGGVDPHPPPDEPTGEDLLRMVVEPEGIRYFLTPGLKPRGNWPDESEPDGKDGG